MVPFISMFAVNMVRTRNTAARTCVFHSSHADDAEPAPLQRLHLSLLNLNHG